MSSVTEGNVRPDDRDAGTETNEKGKAVCEACGKPATQCVEISIDMHFRCPMHEGDPPEDWDYCDTENGEELPVKFFVCDSCDVGWTIPPKLLERLAECFEAYVPENEDDQARADPTSRVAWATT
jgi:hypothetical protein